MKKRPSLFLGMIVGAIFGLAFAPKKGKELRDELKDELKKGGNGKKLLKSTAVEVGKDFATTAKEFYEDPNVQKQISKGKTEFGKAVKEVNKEISKKRTEIGKMAKEHFKDTQSKINTAKKKVSNSSSKTSRLFKKKS